MIKYTTLRSRWRKDIWKKRIKREIDERGSIKNESKSENKIYIRIT